MGEFVEKVFAPWPWYVAGPLIGLFVPLLLVVFNRQFGISSSLEQICYLVLPGAKKVFINYKSKDNSWKVFLVAGIALGAFISTRFLTDISVQFLPQAYFTPTGMAKLSLGGFLVGFGTRYANGCTSGHAITGLSMLSKDSLIATIAFFAGGLFYTFLL